MPQNYCKGGKLKVNNKFNVGDTVFTVRCGDVEKGVVAQMWELKDDPKEVGYSVRGCSYGCFWNPDIGVSIFRKPMDAVNAAVAFIKTHDCILAKDMQFVERQDFSGNNYHHTPCVFGVFADGKMYVKDNYTFAHVVDYGDVYSAKEALFKIRQKKLLEGEREIEATAKLKNVYRCEAQKGGKEKPWIYSEAGYDCIIQNPEKQA
jgi:hypothetical protein